jgi:hypothetical protein
VKKEPEYKEPTKFMNFAENVNVKVVANANGKEGKAKRGVQKIQKVDFDFNFDNFNDVNFSSFSGDNGNNSVSANNGNTVNGKSIDADFDDVFSNDKKKKKNKYDDEEEDNSNSFKPKISKDEINKKFANKKAISSEDYANLEEDPSQNTNFKNKINSMKYNNAISSSDFYGEPEDGKIFIK